MPINKAGGNMGQQQHMEVERLVILIRKKRLALLHTHTYIKTTRVLIHFQDDTTSTSKNIKGLPANTHKLLNTHGGDQPKRCVVTEQDM